MNTRQSTVATDDRDERPIGRCFMLRHAGVAAGTLALATVGLANQTSATAATGPSEVPPPVCVAAQDPVSSVDVEIAGQSRTALVYVPIGIAPTTPAPVILSFHGSGDDTRQLDEWDGFKSMADSEGFVVVHPQGSAVEVVPGIPSDPGWDVLGLEVDEAAFMAALLDELARKVCVDLDHVFATGISLGGALALSLSCTLGDRLAAVAVVAALPLYQCPNPRPMPTLMFHGLNDLFVPYEGVADFGLPSIEDAAASIAIRNGCTDAPATTETVAAGVDRLTWANCAASTILYRIADHGHAWPGHVPALTVEGVADVLEANGVVPPGLTPSQAADNLFQSTSAIDATALIWEFFVRQA